MNIKEEIIKEYFPKFLFVKRFLLQDNLYDPYEALISDSSKIFNFNELDSERLSNDTNIKYEIYIVNDRTMLFTLPGIDSITFNVFKSYGFTTPNDIIRSVTNLNDINLRFNQYNTLEKKFIFDYDKNFVIYLFCNQQFIKNFSNYYDRRVLYFHETGHWLKEANKKTFTRLFVSDILTGIDKTERYFLPKKLKTSYFTEFLRILLRIIAFIFIMLYSILSIQNENTADKLLKDMNLSREAVEVYKKVFNMEKVDEKEFKKDSELVRIFLSGFKYIVDSDNVTNTIDGVVSHPSSKNRIINLLKENEDLIEEGIVSPTVILKKIINNFIRKYELIIFKGK